MYTWSYIKEAALGKLAMTADEASEQDLLNLFPIYANEVITQVCSSIKPKYSYAEFEITNDMVGEIQKMPEDFVSFGDDVCYEKRPDKFWDFFHADDERKRTLNIELHDDDFSYHGYNEVVFNHAGHFFISYNARWYTFNAESEDSNITDDQEVIPVPADILDCIPSYIASQCYKIDDEYKASVFRNEYEMLLARIDNTNFKKTKTFVIGGDW